jgi:hypothetical protein
MYCTTTDTSHFRLLVGCSLLNTMCVTFELVDSAALLWSKNCGGGGQIVFLNLTTIIKMAALSTIHDVTDRSLVRSCNLLMRYLCVQPINCWFSKRCDYTSLREGVYLYTMTPWRIANKLRGECSYQTPLRVVLSTKKLGIRKWG